MTTKDNSPGLLSKVAKFVRNPTVNWSDLDNKDSDPDSVYSKQALKEMIERKRQNDFVRRREFDQLRKIRNRDPAVVVEGAGRPSFYHSSIPSNLDERAVTLKKIDEIEAQMSKQWWKGKQVAGADNAGNFPVSGGEAAPTEPPAGERTTDFAQTKPGAEPGHTGADAPEFAPTRMSPGLHGEANPAQPGQSARTEEAGAGFSTSKLFAVELSDDATDPDLEEAAIRFANGDDAGAETGLLEALKGAATGSPSIEIWTSALFDFYRATGQQSHFEKIALEFAQSYGRSAPAWVSMREQIGVKAAQAGGGAADLKVGSQPVWRSPAQLDAVAVDNLRLVIAGAAVPYHLDWRDLATVSADALKGLGAVFAQWCGLVVTLRFDGADVLQKVLKSGTPSGDKKVSTLRWQIRMDALRIMDLQDEFELVALDYCVTYEVSPPSWTAAQCEYMDDGSGASRPKFSDTSPLSRDMMPGHGGPDLHNFTAPMGLEDVPAVVVELAGEIMGDAADALQRLEVGRHQGAGRLVVSCAKLIRVDFSAAGSILNWVASRENEGCNVQFREVHRLIGAFFNVIGINEHARVVLRAN